MSLPPTTTTTPTPSVRPASPVAKADRADAPTADGAEAFARYWIDVVNSAYVTLDTKQLREISSPSCQTCRNYIKSLGESAQLEETYEGGQYRVRSAAATPPVGRASRVLVSYSAPRLVVRNKAGKVVDTERAEKRGTLVIDLSRHGSSWLVKEAARYVRKEG